MTATTIECPRCGHRLSGSETACPSCGMRLGAEAGAVESATSLVRGYFSDVWRILTQPSRFFGELPLSGGYGPPLAFALVTHWIGKSGSFLWHSALGWTTFDWLSRYATEQPVWLDKWLIGVGSVVTDPFATLFSILFTSAFVFAGARILVNGIAVSYESAVRLVCYGMTPSILAALPFFGWGLSSVLSVVVTVIGAKKMYRTGTGRAIVIALFPKILFFAFFAIALLFLGLILAKFVTAFL